MTRIAVVATKWGLGAGRRWGILMAALALSGGSLLAQENNAATGNRAVRLSYVQGHVQISDGAQAITSKAAANMPVFERYRIETGKDGQTEIQFEDGSVARIAPDSTVTLTVLRGQGSSGQAEMVLNRGLGYFELQGGDQAGRIEVGFGDAKVTAAGFTVMRVDEDKAPGNLAVFSGNAHLVQGNAVTLDLHGNESVSLSASDPSHYNLAETVETNSWDQWNSDRDQALQAESATKSKATDSFVNSDNPAWNDLNSSGNWYDVPGSGFVWSPYMAVNAGWDPYGCGQWMFTPQFGYTWVSCYAWGFMPYSCGMWNFYGSFGWGWSPGAGGCNPWWGAGFGGYRGPNIGIAPSGYRPVARPPLVLHSPRSRLPRPILVNREPKHGYGDHPLRSTNGPVLIAGHMVAPLEPMPVRTSFLRPAGGTVPAGGAANRAIITGSRPRPPVVTDRGSRRHGYTQPAHGASGEGYQQPRARGNAPPAQRSAPMTGRPAGGARPSGGSYSGRGNSGGGAYSGGAARSGAGGGGGFHGGGAAPAAGGGARAAGGGGGHR